jgi:hypothetical protein
MRCDSTDGYSCIRCSTWLFQTFIERFVGSTIDDIVTIGTEGVIGRIDSQTRRRPRRNLGTSVLKPALSIQTLALSIQTPELLL